MPSQIVPFYQPIVSIDTCEILGYEVLGRKITANKIESLGPFFHDSQIDVEQKLNVDRYLRKTALENFEKYNTGGMLFINIQPQWIYRFKDIPEQLPTLEFICRAGVPEEKIVIEISESEFQGDMELLVELICRYRQAGCKIAIDDVGCGFSNMDRIIHLHPNFLKIDASLVKKSGQEELTACLLESMGLFSERMGLELIFEGIENREQFTAGLRAGARHYQGFFFSSPGPRLLSEENWSHFLEKDLKGHVALEVSSLERQMEKAQEMNTFLDSLIHRHRPQTLEEYIDCFTRAAPSEWFRIYACDEKGFQQTPNYIKNNDGRWSNQPEFQNRYWGWRPYFVPTIAKVKQIAKGLFSDFYYDLSTRERITTFCYPLGRNMFLYIDCNFRCL